MTTSDPGMDAIINKTKAETAETLTFTSPGTIVPEEWDDEIESQRYWAIRRVKALATERDLLRKNLEDETCAHTETKRILAIAKQRGLII